MEENEELELTALDEARIDAFAGLKSLEPGSEEYLRQVKAVAELEQAGRDENQLMFDQNRTLESVEIEKKKSIWNRIIDIGKIVVPAGVTAICFILGEKYADQRLEEVEDFESRDTFSASSSRDVARDSIRNKNKRP